jgi:hypothetical protein
MKLKLRAENDIQVLTISEIDSSQNVDVLRAGITKLFKNGKNRIVLELTEAKTVPAEVMRELGRLKLLANELAGDIVISGVDAQTKQKIDSFAKPPFAVSFPATAQAIAYLKQIANPPPKDSAPAPVAKAAAPAPSPSATAPAPAASHPAPQGHATDPSQHQQEILTKEMGELGALKKQVEQLRKENLSLTAILAQKIWERREPGDVDTFRDRVSELEDKLAKILAQPPEKKK